MINKRFIISRSLIIHVSGHKSTTKQLYISNESEEDMRKDLLVLLLVY